jgi:hypothetical protein
LSRIARTGAAASSVEASGRDLAKVQEAKSKKEVRTADISFSVGTVLREPSLLYVDRAR